MWLPSSSLLQVQKLVSWFGGAGAPVDPTGSRSDGGLRLAGGGGGSMRVHPLFGDSRPWNESGRVAWVSVDDRVRGGSSVSHLDACGGGGGGGGRDARFWGTLDTKTLGGAGFASSTTRWRDEDAALDLGAFDGILLEVVRADAKRYTLNLKDRVPPRRPDGRMQSGVSWEYDFELPGAGGEHPAPATTTTTTIRIPWSAFKATYRGRDVEHPEPLKTTHIRTFSVMMRSFFEKQEGDFELVLRSIAAYSTKDDSEQSQDEGRSQL